MSQAPLKMSAEELNKLQQMFGQAAEIKASQEPPQDAQEIPLIYYPDGIDPPKRGSPQAAGYDISSPIEIVIPPRSTIIIDTGIYITIPFGWIGMIASRSGLGVKKGITVAQGIGIIDPDYRGEIKIGLYNRNDEPYTVSVNDKVAQLMFIPFGLIPFQKVNTIQEITDGSRTHRGSGGFGSTDSQPQS